MNHAASPPATRTVRLRIRRCDGPGKPTRWESFDVRVEPGANIISCLQQIAEQPITTDGARTTPVAWDAGCLEEVCGACTMVINGKVRQSCTCLVDRYAPADGDTITLEPMSKFPIIRDLWVDRSRLFNDLRRISGWVPVDSTYAMGAGPKESTDEQQTRYTLSTCMSCGCCLEACPQYTLEQDADAAAGAFVGAAVISQVRYFNMHPTGAALASKRLDVMTDPGGVADCGNAQNCLRVCPKEIPLTESIAAIGRAATWHGIKRFFTGP